MKNLNQKGYIQIIFLTALGGSLVFAMSQVTQFVDQENNKRLQKQKTLFAIQILKSTLDGYLLDGESRQKSLQQVANQNAKKCLDNPNLCTSSEEGDFSLYDRQNGLIWGPHQNMGFDLSGKNCVHKGTLECPLEILLKWSLRCENSTGPCLNPSLDFNYEIFSTVSDVQTAIVANKSKFNLKTKNTDDKAVSEMCQGMGGVFDTSTQLCDFVLFASHKCSDGQFVKGLTPPSLGQPPQIICSDFPLKTCPKGQLIVGMDTNGGYICQ